MPPKGLTLAFDTAAAHCAAALLSGTTLLAEAEEAMTKGQAERLFPLLEDLLASAGAGWRDVARIGVGIGPGNFTGTRISVAAARGLAVSLNVPALGVTSFESLALDHIGPVLTSVDARAGRVYLQWFDEKMRGQPVTADIDRFDPAIAPPGCTVIGHRAETLAEFLGTRTADPAHPTAHAIALIAATGVVDPAKRPAPLYMHPPDAAPPRDQAPRMLP